MNNNPTTTLFIGQPLVRLSECHSTNAWLSQEVAQKAATGKLPEGFAVVANHQTQGKGQRGNSWEAAADQNITLSVLVRPTWLAVHKQFGLSMAAALAVHEVLSGFASDFQIKWPNDIFWQKSKKISGILIENTVQSGRLAHSIVGIGINVNQSQFAESKAVSLGQIVGNLINKETVLARLLSCFEARYLQLKSNYEILKNDYLSKLLHFRQEAVYVRQSDGLIFSGQITDVSNEGIILIETATGPMYFGFKEVALRQ